jgi:hypothetical protein
MGAPLEVDLAGSFTLRSRERHLTVLAGVRTGPLSGFNVTWLGGFTYVTSSFGARLGNGQAIDFDESGMKLTFGGDVKLPITRDVSLVFPLRFTPGVDITPVRDRGIGLGVRAGVGLAFTYRRQAM